MKSIWKIHNDKIVYAIRLLWWLRFTLPIWFFFYTQYLWVSVSLSTFIAVLSVWVAMVFEIPTWTWADKYGRKRIYMIGMVIQMIAFLPLLLTKDILVITMWVAIYWFWWALISWTLGPLVFDWYQSMKEEFKYKKFTRLSSSLVFWWRAVATIIWWRLFTLNPLYPYFWVLLLKLIQLLLANFLYESDVSYQEKEIPIKDYIVQWWKYLTSSYHLNTILIWITLGHLFASILWWLYQPFLEFNDRSITHIWWFYALVSVISMVWSYATKYFYNDSISEKLLTVIYIVLIIFTLINFLYLDWYRVLVWVIGIQLAFGMHNPVTDNVINHHIPSSHRATANSIYSLLNSSWWFVWWSVCGLLATYLWFTWVWIVLLIAISVLLIVVLMRRKKSVL